MQNSRNMLTIEDTAFRKHLKERNCLWLPVPLPLVSDVSSDVALWLFELRHLNDASDIPTVPDDVNLDADCDALVQELSTCEDNKLLQVPCQESCVSTDETASSRNATGLSNESEIYEEIINTELLKENPSEINENTANSTNLTSEKLNKDHVEVSAENMKENDCQDNKEDDKLSTENSKEDCQINRGTFENNCLEKEICELSGNTIKVIDNLIVENSPQNDGQKDTDTVKNTIVREEISVDNSLQNEGGTNEQPFINIVNLKEKHTIELVRPSFVAKITRPHSYGGGELASYSHIHRSVACILWEANPLYGAVGDKGQEGRGRGSRKLCQSYIEELGNSVSKGPVEYAYKSSSIIYKTQVLEDEKVNHSISDSVVNFTSDNCESESNPMLKEVSVDTSDNKEDNSNHIDSEAVCADNKDANILQSENVSDKAGSSETTDICEIIRKNFQNEDGDYENTDNLLMSTDDSGNSNKRSAKMSYDEQCEEVLNDLERVIQSLEVEDEEFEDCVIEPDNDFLDLCKEADDLAEESIQQCPPVPVIHKINIARSITMSSDLSDDVFVNSPSKEEGPVLFPVVTEVRRHRSLDINTIFDDGTKPPVPPARKKRSKDDRYKTVPQINAYGSCVSESIATNPSREQEVKENVDDNVNQTNDSMQEITDSNFISFENQPQELAIIKRVSDMTKEKRNAKVASQYEDANSCCEQCQAGECNLTTCSQNSNIAAVPNPASSTPNREVKVSVSDENGQVHGINVTPLRPIFTLEFPPSENTYIEKRHSAIPILDNKSVNSCDDSGISLPSDSVLRSRKGSTSSDIEAWKQELQLSGFCYLDEEFDVNSMFQQEEWFSSNDSEGRIYFFEENSNESSWTLPEVRVTTCDSPTPTKATSKETKMGAKKPTKEEKQLEGDVQLRLDQQGKDPEAKSQYRMAKAHSMAMLESSSGKQASSKSSSFPRNWPQLWEGNMCLLKEGTLNRTKITENGKKLRKNWAPAHVVLTELFLLFFKDPKTFAAMKNAQGDSSSAARLEFSVDLNGALLEHGEKASSRRNVFLVSTVLGLQVLVQCENGPQAEEWYQAIQKAITDLPSAYDSCPRNKAPKLSPPTYLGSHSPEEFKKSSRIGRSRSVKSVKLSAKDGSQEDLTFSPDENQTKIKNRLKKFFHRRPTKESLVKKGIYKDEPVFGCHLADVCKGESPKVPAFVQRCIAVIECKEENMKTDGLYRASGNLSQVQKIRLQVDQNNLSMLELEEDVHVLTGALKLFFRELKKPLIPFEYFNKALKASTNQNKKEKLQQFRDIVKALPQPNRDTLEFLLRHLLRVTKYQDSNRMHIPNLAIVFGPTLMWPEAESLNMALDLMQQNLVIECFLQEFENIFR